MISRGGYSAFVGAVRPAAPTIPSLQIMHLQRRLVLSAAPTNHFSAKKKVRCYKYLQQIKNTLPNSLINSSKWSTPFVPNYDLIEFMAPFASQKKQAEILFRLICRERKTLFRLKKQAEKDGLLEKRTGPIFYPKILNILIFQCTFPSPRVLGSLDHRIDCGWLK